MKRIRLLLIMTILLGGCGSTEIAGVSDEGGCFPFETSFDTNTFVEVIRNECPFEMAFRFTLEQDGCKLTFIDAGPGEKDIHGVINQQGIYGAEIQDTDGTVYECQGDIVEDSRRGTFFMTCDSESSCRVELEPV